MAAREFVLYRGEKFWIQTTGRYFQSGRKNCGKERILHRRVWEDAHGNIPERHHVHHIDGDWRNNDLSNLELIDEKTHQRNHKMEALSQPGALEKNMELLERAREAAKEWHGSDAGRKWHSEHGKRTWEGREPIDAVCDVCGSAFKSFFPGRSGRFYCSSACRQKIRFRTYFTDKKKCLFCGEEFMANRHRKTACCSRTCANRYRAANESLQPDSRGE